MKKPRTVLIMSIMLMVALASYLYLSIGPCSRPKIEVGYSNITDLLNQWEEVLEFIESPKSTGISQGRVDSMEQIKRQTASAIVPQCMMLVKLDLYFGMEARISAYSAILEKALLLDELNTSQQPIPLTGNSATQVEFAGIFDQISELEDKAKNLFIASETYMIDFNSSVIKFANRLNED